MTPGLDVPAFERGVIRVFSPDATDPSLAAVLPPHPVDAGHFAPLLGLSTLSEDGIDRITLSDLADFTLSEFLQIGHDLSAETLAAHRETLDQLKGHLFLVHSSAFSGKAVTLRPASGLVFVGAFRQTELPPAPIALPEKEKPEVLTPPGQSLASRRTGSLLPLVLLAIVALAFVLYTLF